MESRARHREYWKSNKNQKSFAEHQRRLQSFFGFLNAEITRLGEDEYMDLVSHYVDFVFVEGQGSRFIQLTELQKKYTQDFGTDSSPEILSRMKSFFSMIQSHLRARVEAIIYAVEWGKTNLLLEIEGIRKVIVQPSTDSITEEFSDTHGKPGVGLDLEHEKRLADIRFADLTRDLDLIPSRFRSCSRCGNLFYQPTSRAKHFCSTSCARAIARAKYEERKHKREDGS